MAAPSDMFVTVMRHSGLSNNEIENAIFQIAQKHSTDDHDIIADTFLEAHRCGIAAGVDEGDVEGFRIEIKNFFTGVPISRTSAPCVVASLPQHRPP